MLNYIDAHIHLEQYSEEARSEHLATARAAGVTHVVAVSMDLASSKATYELSDQFDGMIMPAYGFHPEQPILSAQEEQELVAWIRQRAARHERFAIGEVGLPYYTAEEAKERGERFDKQPYTELLERFIVLAKQLDRPIVLHAVYEDAALACDLLQKHQYSRAHFHWFKGDEATIKRMIENGYFISITPDVDYEADIQALVQQYPLELIMIETDGPWPFEGKFEQQETQSAMVVEVAASIAQLKNMPLEQVVRQLYNNSKTFYAI